MKSFLLTIVAFSIILCIFGIGTVSAFSQDSVSVTASWPSVIYQGDSVAVSITFQSNIADELEITRVGIQFDWMPEDAYYSYDSSADPVSISGLGSHTFYLTNITIIGASAGSHSYIVSVDCLLGDVEFIWDSPSSTIKIYSGYEKTYSELISEVSTKIDEAENATYVNTEAQSLLQQAKEEYLNALTLANDEEWQDAVTSLQNASDYLDEAAEAEQTGGPLAEPNFLLYLVVAAIVAVVVLSVIAVVVSRRKKKTVDSVM